MCSSDLRTICISSLDSEKKLDGELVIASRGFLNGEFASCLGDSFATAFASGWAARDHDRRMGRIDHAFPLSDHADWDDLLRTIRDTGARRVVVQHRGSGALVRYLRRIGLHAHSVYDLRRKNDQQLTLF